MSQNTVTLLKRKRDNKGEDMGAGNATSFGEHKRPDGADGLLAAARLEAIRGTDIVPAAAGMRTAAAEQNIDEWHDLSFVTAEHGVVPKMPDDFTPHMTGGQALTGHRRAHRIKYEGAGVELRMYSATNIRAYALESGNKTFDIPVSAEYPGGTVQGWLRVTPQGKGAWGVAGLGMDEKSAAYVAEAAAAVLESRTPSVALGRVKDLMVERKKRFAQSGVAVELVPTEKSGFIAGVGYHKESGNIIVQMSGRAYRYKAGVDKFNMLLKATSPGHVYNALKKGSESRSPVVRCATCDKWSTKSKVHRCASICACQSPSCRLPHSHTKGAPRVFADPNATAVFPQNQAVRQAAARRLLPFARQK